MSFQAGLRGTWLHPLRRAVPFCKRPNAETEYCLGGVYREKVFKATREYLQPGGVRMLQGHDVQAARR